MRILSGLVPILLLAACTTAPPPPPPAVAAAPAPVPLPPASPADWRDLPLTPGAWRYQAEAGGSVALFGDGVAALRCDRMKRQVSLTGSGLSGSLKVTTSFGIYPIAGPLAASDPILDSIAFSRGRFVVMAGAVQRVLPSWPEVARVVEDCRS